MANSKGDWYFTKDQLENSPSRQCGIEAYKELSYRQQAANFIQDMGLKLKVTLLCSNTAIVYMHRFYVFHSLTHFHWQSIAAAALFLAAKVEEQPRKLEHVIKAVNSCKRLDDSVDPERFKFWSQELAYNENILLQTLGFEVAIDHPHTHVVRCCHLVRASKDLAQTSYIIASNSLHLTTMCLRYKPTVVACFCIHFVCKWANWEIPLSNEKKQWYTYVDQSVTSELLEQLANEFLVIYEQCPSRLKEKIMAISGEAGVQLPYNNSGHAPSLPLSFQEGDKRTHGEIRTGTFRPPHEPPSSSGQHRDKKDRVSHHNSLQPKSHSSGSKHEPSGHHHGHVPSVDPKFSKHLRISSMGHITNTKAEPKDILRDASRDAGLNDGSKSGKDVASSRDVTQQMQRNEKREYAQQQRQEIKPSNSLGGVSSGTNLSVDPNRSRPVDPNRSRPVDPKLQTRRREEPTKPYPNKLESDIKKHLSAVVHDKNSLLQKPVSNSTSHRNKYLEQSKSIPNQVVKSDHQQQYNGANSNGAGSAPSTASSSASSGSSNGGLYGLPMVDDEPIAPVKSQALVHPNHHHPQTPVQQNQVVVPVMPTRKPGLFSPDQTPPKKSKSKSPSNFSKKLVVETNSLHQNNVEQQRQQLQQEHVTNSKLNRRRTSSTNSEPELRPVMKKIDEIQGFENIMRDSSIGLKAHNKVPEVVAPAVTESLVPKEFKPPDFKVFNANTNTTIINGIETDPTIISSLLKETPTVSTHLPRTSSAPSLNSTPSITIKVENEGKKKDSSHKEHKKNKKEKHKHKDKDKEKNREEKEKKKKHKEKDREKHKHKHSKQEASNDPTAPIKLTLTIPRDKFTCPILPDEVAPPVKPELKLKILRDKHKIENISEISVKPPATNSGIKIKIPREAYINVNNKREREKNSTTNEEPPSKVYKSNYNRYADTKNVRNSYDKVVQLGDGETSIHRLAESKYINKGATT